MNIKLSSPLKSIALLCFTVLSFAVDTSAQRDYFTAEEIEVIRDAQEIDRRIAALVHAMDRRFSVLKIDVAAPPFKENTEWGELPKGSRTELLSDIRRIMHKAVDDIDNLAERPDSGFLPDKDSKESSRYSELFPKAVRTLAAAAARYTPVFKTELDKTTSNAERGYLIDSIDLSQQVIDSVTKLPPDAPKKSKKN